LHKAVDLLLWKLAVILSILSNFHEINFNRVIPDEYYLFKYDSRYMINVSITGRLSCVISTAAEDAIASSMLLFSFSKFRNPTPIWYYKSQQQSWANCKKAYTSNFSAPLQIIARITANNVCGNVYTETLTSPSHVHQRPSVLAWSILIRK